MKEEHTQIHRGDKLYIIVRKDLEPGIQIAQACHAAIEFSLKNPDKCNEWHVKSNYIAILAAKDEEELEGLHERLHIKKINHLSFRESDLDNQLTAIAIEPGDKSRRITSSFPLALKK